MARGCYKSVVTTNNTIWLSVANFIKLHPSVTLRGNKLECFHRNKTRVQRLAKNVSSFEIIMFAVYGPHSWLWHKAKKKFFWSNLVFYNKSKILTILFIVKYWKITLFEEFLVFFGPIISRFFTCSNKE